MGVEGLPALGAAAATAICFDGEGYHAPHCEACVLGYDYGSVAVIGWHQQYAAVAFDAESLEGEFAVDAANRQVAVLRLQRFVDHEYIAVSDPLLLHGVAHDTGVKRGCRVLHEFAVEIDTVRHIVLSRAWEAGSYATVGIWNQSDGGHICIIYYQSHSFAKV